MDAIDNLSRTSNEDISELICDLAKFIYFSDGTYKQIYKCLEVFGYEIIEED